MASDINHVTLVGRLTADAEIRQAGGAQVASFQIAVNRSIKRENDWKTVVSFFGIEKWNPGGVAKYLTKGQQVAVSGELRQDRWEKDGQKRSRIFVVTDRLQLIGSVKKGPSDEEDQADFDDDIPF